MATHRQSRFVVLEGLDGAGSTTQTAILAGVLRERGVDVCVTAEPSDGPLGRVARAHVRGEISLPPHATALTFVADRAEHVARVIRPALRAGRSVLCDRYVLSTLAYQGAEGVDKLWVLEASEPLLRPDLTVYLDVPDAQRRTRMSSRTGTERYEVKELQEPIRRSYFESIDLLAARGHHIAVVDGSREKGAVSAAVLAELDALP